MTDNKPTFQILALSGGGYRGLYTAKVLEKLEEGAGKPISSCFDLICGTSIGGIIALGLGAGVPAGKIAELIEQHGRSIFYDERSQFVKFLCKFRCIEMVYYLKRSKYGNQKLEALTKEILGENTMSDGKCRLIIPSVNYTKGKLQTFKTPHLKRFSPAFDVPMWKAAMATSAAPTYFPIWQNQDDRKTYLDGGLIANAPGLLGMHEATCLLNRDSSEIRLLSIGTMNAEARLGRTDDLNKGLSWAEKIFNVITSAQENMADDMLEHLLKDRYHYINCTPTADEHEFIGLDKADQNATDILRGHAETAAQVFLGKPEVSDMLKHQSSFEQPE